MALLNNGKITIETVEHGAELQSIKKEGKEYLWQGDKRYWGRRSPVLFPIVGRVWNDIYRHDNSEYTLGQHGFARDMDFKKLPDDGESLAYELNSNDKTLKLYPFDFSLRIRYRLDDCNIITEWTVVNTGSREMFFQIGAHPAFNMPNFNPDNDLRGYFSFDTDRQLTYITPAEKGCVLPKDMFLKRDSDNNMPICRHTFDCDTYIFEHSQLKRVTLLDTSRNPYLSLSFDAPIVALWSPTATKPDCPFICIEPWYGRCDKVGYEGLLANREWMQRLSPKSSFKALYTITIH